MTRRVPRVDPGWRVVASVGVLLTSVAGFGFYSLAIYVHALTDSGAFTLTTVSVGSSLYLLANGLTGLLVAALLDRVDARAVVAVGTVVMASGIALIGRAGSVPVLLLAYLLLGLGQAACGNVPGTTVVARWFVVKRPKALALASTGLSVGGIVVAPAVSVALGHASLAAVTTVAAAVFLVVCLVATTGVIPSPASRGLAPDGGLAGEEPVEVDGRSRAEALRGRAFWGITAAMTLASVAQIGGLTHLFTLVSSRTTAGPAGVALSCVALGSFTGRFLGSIVLARVSTTTFFQLVLVLQAVALTTLGLGRQPAVLLPAALVFGLTIGNVLLSHPLLLGETFGLRDFARILSLSILIATLGTAGGPVVVAGLRDAGGYALGFLVVAGASFVGAVVLRFTTVTRPGHLGLPSIAVGSLAVAADIELV